MTDLTLTSLHAYLKLLENSAELKRNMPTSSSPRTLKEGLLEVGRVAGVEVTVFRDPRRIAALIGPQRFVMIGGEPSATDQVARILEGSKVLLTVLIDLPRFAGAPPGQRGVLSTTARQHPSGTPSSSPGWPPSMGDPPGASDSANDPAPPPLDSLKPLLTGNVSLLSRLFRVIFEHLLGFALQSGTPQGGGSLVNDLTGSREHSRPFLATALFILGTETDPDHLKAFMMQRGLFGLPVLEHLLQSRDYCDAFHTFRRLERAFMGAPEFEETQLRNRLDQFNAEFGAEGARGRLFESGAPDKAKLDAYLAAADVLEAMALTPWRMSLSQAISLDAGNSLRSLVVIAGHFERFAKGEATRDQANHAIADHLLAFGRQFSADRTADRLPPLNHADPRQAVAATSDSIHLRVTPHSGAPLAHGGLTG